MACRAKQNQLSQSSYRRLVHRAFLGRWMLLFRQPTPSGRDH
jgi:hypothetical protein